MKRSLVFLSMAAVLVAAGVLAGCAPTVPTAAPTAAPKPPAAAATTSPGGAVAGATAVKPAASGQTREVHFYSINPLTGQSAAYGTKAANNQQLYVDWVNSQGGFTDSAGNRYTIKLTMWDMANSREQSIAGYRQAAQDPSVAVVLGPTADVGNLPIIPVAGQLQVPYIIASQGATITNWNPYTFRISTDSATLAPLTLKALVDKIGMKSVAIIYDQTQDAQNFEAEIMRKEAEKMSIPVVAYEAVRAGDVDMKQQLTKIKAANADWVIVECATPEASRVVNQMAELGIQAKIFVSFGTPLDPAMYDLTGGKVEGTYTMSPGITGPGVKYNEPKAVELYQQKYGEIPFIWAVIGWDAASAAVDAIKRAGSTDHQKVRDALGNTTNFPAAEGGFINWKNPPHGDNLTPPMVVVKVTGKNQWELMFQQ